MTRPQVSRTFANSDERRPKKVNDPRHQAHALRPVHGERLTRYVS